MGWPLRCELVFNMYGRSARAFIFLDAVFANRGQPNRVCLGDGTGSLNTCSDVSADTNKSEGVALGQVTAPLPVELQTFTIE